MSESRFADGLRYRIEIPSVEGPRVLEAVPDLVEGRGDEKPSDLGVPEL
ncbi:MAG TPA: hypothetical protein VJ807_07855 [Gaiellaceae bacterium]|nr:hypothetical protein [Gaiellaceae bacterium]